MVARSVLVLLAIVVWGYGFRVDDSRIRLAGIALLVLSLVLRFFRRRQPPDTDTAG